MHYLLPFILGMYFYLAHQTVFFFRFQRFNSIQAKSDFIFYLIGVISVALFLFFLQKLDRKQTFFIFFFGAACISFFTSILGGLLGTMGILLFGLSPFFIILPIGYFLLKR